MSVGVELTGLEQAIKSVLDKIGEGADQGAIAAAKVVADQAKSSHPYTDRSGDLTSSITPPDYTSGSLASGNLECAVVAMEPYAGFVEAKGFKFLEPAFEASIPQVEQAFATAVEQALNK